MSSFRINVSRTEGMSVSVSRLKHTRINVSVVLDTGPYLVVAPTFLWVTTDYLDEDIDVKSNTKWDVE